MKNLFLILFIPILAFGVPDWFFNIEHDKKHEIVGYGMDSDLKKAKQNAILDITNSISVSVNSSVNISTSDFNGQTSQNASVNLQTKSKAILSGVDFIKIKKENDIWFVGAKYDNSPLEIKFKKILPKKLKNEKQNRYLKNTRAIKNLNSTIGKKLNYTLIRKNNLWQLKYKDILVPITGDNLYKFFSNQKNRKISIKANKSIYQENDNMNFIIKHKNKGYISILYVEHNGKVGVLLANQRSNKSFIYPKKDAQDIFKITNPYNKTIKELYIAIYSKKPIELYEFENVSENLLDESNYNFNKLIEKLNYLDFSTFVIKIRG
jgi:hypothetical protein